MSLNKFTDIQTGKDLKLKIGCQLMECGAVVNPIGGLFSGHDILARNKLEYLTTDTKLVNLSTPDRGQNNYSLHTDGVGACFWSPDDTGSGDITYNGTQPAVIGQHFKTSSTDGTTADESKLLEDATNLNLGALNITNVGLVDGEDVSGLATQQGLNTTAIGDNASDITSKLSLNGTDLMTGELKMNTNSISGVVNINGVVYPPPLTPDATKLNIDGTSVMTGDLNMGTKNISNVGLVDGEDVSVLATQQGTNTTNIGNNSTAIVGKLDKDGTSDLKITKAVSTITLKDNVSIGNSNGVLRFTDSLDADIGSITSNAGCLCLAREGVVKLELKATENKSNQDLNMDNNDISGVVNINGVAYPPPPTPDATKLNIDGTSTMTGDLKMDTFNITTSGLVDGVDVSVLSGSVSTNSGNITTLQGDRLKINGTNNMAGALNMVGNDINNVNEIYVQNGVIIGQSQPNAIINMEGKSLNFLLIPDNRATALDIRASQSIISLDSTTGANKVNVKCTLDMSSQKITSLATPVTGTDATNKDYVDTATDGVVIGPASAVNSNLCSFDTTTGELIKDSGILHSDVMLKTGDNVMNGDLALLTAGNTELVITTTDPFNLARILLSANGVLSSMRQSDSRLRIASNNNRIDLDSVVSEIALSTSGTPRLTISDTEVLSYLPVVTDQSFRQYRAVNPAQNGFPVLSGMYSMISSRVIGGTLTETSCFNDSGAVGTRTNPANTLAIGDTYHLHMSGLVQTDGKGHGMTFRLKMGATTLMATNSDDWDAGGTPTFWELEVDFVIRTIGSLGTMIGGGMVTFSEDSWWKDAGSFSTTSDLAVNTTISNTFDVTAQWDNANANNVLTTQVATITRRF